MTGVVMAALGPGYGPVTPAELVTALSAPLGRLLPAAARQGDPLDDLVLLDEDGSLSDATFEVACDYTQVLFDSVDPGAAWLPAWAWQRGEQVERGVFADLASSASDKDYSTARRFIVEHPAGDSERKLADLANATRVRRVASYEPIPDDRVWRHGSGPEDRCWWPCPACGWPMRVRGGFVGCSYGPHEARFRLEPNSVGEGRVPRLVPVSSRRVRTPAARPAASACCVDLAVWRFITVPGLPELELAGRLSRMDGVKVDVWPGRDYCDVRAIPPVGEPWDIDVKDHADPRRIAEDPPAAGHVVVPSYRRGQVAELRRLLPDKRVWTMDAFVRRFTSHVASGVVR
jgi:hypothetical protein